jgi:two-component system response regulator AtoC
VGGARVLLVDDDPGLRFALDELFRGRGFETTVAASGAEALERMEGVEAVVCDLVMPGMDGVELLQGIRARDEGLPVVLLTAHGSERVAVAAMKAGAYDYVKKPFDADELALSVERAIELRQLRRDARRAGAERLLGRRIVGRAPRCGGSSRRPSAWRPGT